MTLPEHELAATCDHGTTIGACDTDECSTVLLAREREYAEQYLAHAAEAGEFEEDQ